MKFWTYVSSSKGNGRCCLLCKDYLLSFSTPAFVCCYSCLTECELLTSDCSIWNFRQRVTFQHTVNANDLCTCALPVSCRFRVMYHVWVYSKGDEFIGNFLTVCWRRNIVVRTLFSAGELSLSCARLLAGWVTTLWLSRSLSVSQHGQLSHPSLRGR